MKTCVVGLLLCHTRDEGALGRSEVEGMLSSCCVDIWIGRHAAEGVGVARREEVLVRMNLSCIKMLGYSRRVRALKTLPSKGILRHDHAAWVLKARAIACLTIGILGGREQDFDAMNSLSAFTLDDAFVLGDWLLVLFITLVVLFILALVGTGLHLGFHFAVGILCL